MTIDALAAIILRDLRLAYRRLAEAANPLVFFVVVASLFPLAMTPVAAKLQDVGVAVLWVAALLSSLLALDGLFRSDAEDGSMEQFVLSPAPLGLVVLAKTIAHWLITGLPLVIIAPLIAGSFYMPLEAMVTTVIALLLATPTFSVLGAIGASLTVGVRRASGLLGLLFLPLASPVLIFGTRATELAAQGESPAGPLYLLGALLVLAISLGPLAAAAALKVSLE